MSVEARVALEVYFWKDVNLGSDEAIVWLEKQLENMRVRDSRKIAKALAYIGSWRNPKMFDLYLPYKTATREFRSAESVISMYDEIARLGGVSEAETWLERELICLSKTQILKVQKALAKREEE